MTWTGVREGLLGGSRPAVALAKDLSHRLPDDLWQVPPEALECVSQRIELLLQAVEARFDSIKARFDRRNIIASAAGLRM